MPCVRTPECRKRMQLHSLAHALRPRRGLALRAVNNGTRRAQRISPMPTFKVTLCAFTSALLIGCAGIGVTSTSDPAEKLRDAYYLTERADRPLVAERLIREALDIYARNNDQLGIAEAYKQYGLFFSSDSLAGKWSTYYKNNGFLDKTVSYDGRYTKAIEYLEKARAILRELQKYDAL